MRILKNIEADEIFSLICVKNNIEQEHECAEEYFDDLIINFDFIVPFYYIYVYDVDDWGTICTFILQNANKYIIDGKLMLPLTLFDGELGDEFIIIETSTPFLKNDLIYMIEELKWEFELILPR